jgi:hypothetical protein
LVGKRARLRTIRDLDAAALRLHHVDRGRISASGAAPEPATGRRCSLQADVERSTCQHASRLSISMPGRTSSVCASSRHPRRCAVFGPIRRSTAFNTGTAEDAPAELIRPDARANSLYNPLGEALLHGSQQAARRVRAYPQPH